MNKKTVGFLAVFSIAAQLSACGNLPKQAELGEGLKSTMQQNEVQHALLVTKDGRIVPVDGSGKTLHRCEVNEKETTCRSLKKATVHELQNITIIKSTVNPTCRTYVSNGWAYEECWD